MEPEAPIKTAENAPQAAPSAADIVRAARRRCGLKQRDFARLIGASQQYMSLVEHGGYAPSAKMMARVEAVLAERGIPDAIRSVEEANLLHIYRGLSPDGRHAVTSTAAALAAAQGVPPPADFTPL